MTGSMDFRLNLLANTTGLQQGMNGAKFAVNALVAAMAAVGVGVSVQGLVQATDTYTNLSARINIATKDGGNFNQAMAGIHQVALSTNSSLEATGSLFTRLNTVGKEMGMTQQQALDLTKTVTQAIQVGGGSAQASEAAVQQFIQAMQGGTLRGEEFNSIMENGYGLAEALAKGLGVTTGELRKMAENGELSSERVIKAISSQAASVQATYSQFPLTIGQSLQKITTSWEILIGKMDQSNGASATVAKWLSTLADNMHLLKPIIEDIGNGFSRFGEYYSSIYDQGTIDSLKTTLLSIYETIKTLFNTVLEVGEAFHDVFSDALSTALGFTNGLYPAGEQVSGFQKFIDLLNIALGFLNDGFKTIGIGINLFTGTLYGLASAWYELKSLLSWGDVKEKAVADMEAMRAKSEEYFTKGFDGATKLKSATISAIEEIGKTDEEKNQERIENSQKTLSELKAQEEKHRADYKAISDQRILLEQQLQDAKRSGNQASIDLALKGLADLDKKEEEYNAQSQKITEGKVKAAQDWVNAQLTAADGTQKAADLATQKTLQTTLAAQGLKVEFDSSGKAIVSAMESGTKATDGQSNSLANARKAAQALGLDLDVALNRVSEGFSANKVHLDTFAKGITDLGGKGVQATEAIYQGWEKWAGQAKNSAELDLAKAKLLEFEKQGVLSAKQVQIGMEYLDQVNGKIPGNISEIEKAYKLLGITSKEEATKIADSQMRAFNVMRQSGTASAEQIKKALINMADKIYASGDAAKIAWYESQLSATGLSSTVSDTGRVIVDSMTPAENAVHSLGRAAERSGQGFKEMGRNAREAAEEAKDSIQQWNDALEAKNQAQQEELNKSGTNKATGGSFASYDKAGVIKELKDLGYSDDDARKHAGSIMSAALAKDKDIMMKNYGTGQASSANKAFENLLKQGRTSSFGSQIVIQKLAELANGRGVGSVSAPSISTPSLSNSGLSDSNQPTKTVNVNITSGNKTVKATVPVGQENDLLELLSQAKSSA